MDQHRSDHAEAPGHAPHDDLHFESPGAAAFAELEGEVLAGLVEQATAVLAALAGRDGLEVSRVLDIGSGPGVGTCLLAGRFPAAQVLAVDGSATMLANVAARAARRGLGERVATRQVELPGDLGALDRADVAWASMVLHHVGDEGAALRQIRGTLGPGGLLALVERDDAQPLLAAAAHVGPPGLWERVGEAWDAWFAAMRAGLPGAAPSARYPAMLEAAGFELVAEETLTLDLDPPLDPQARRLAAELLRRTRAHLGPFADAADLEALDALLDERGEGDPGRDDVGLRASRLLYVARAVR